ncbi:aldose 1-epimerase [Bacteroidia bacterium]|nr:aldose 1-epimerase [Bacteroidia bacterium]
MKKNVFVLVAISLLIASCGKKEVAETATESGLLPSKFEYVTEKGDTNHLYVMKNADGMEVTVINIGARIVSLIVPDNGGTMRNVVLGYDSIQPYLQLKDYYGAIVGRYANRIADGTFVLDRVTHRVRQNEGKNLLHGGPNGFSTRFFTIEQPDEQTLICSYFSKDGEEGFPGNLKLTVTYTLRDDNALEVNYKATTDRATVLNVSNHAYFNLSGKDATVTADHLLYINAAQYTPTREDLIPTGKIEKVKNTPLDYSSLVALNTEYPYDLNYVLNHPGEIDTVAAKVVSMSTGIEMDIYTTEPGMQFYLERKTRPSLVLEPQHFPDSPNHPNFPSTILRVDSVFNSQTIYKFGILE